MPSLEPILEKLDGAQHNLLRVADSIPADLWPKHTPAWKRFRLPFALAEIRFVRMKTPIPVDSQLLREKEAMLAELGEVRERTLALIKETRNCNLSVYRWRHPFLGSLNAYEWFSFLGSHRIRHEKQMCEIAGSLLKPISNSQK